MIDDAKLAAQVAALDAIGLTWVEIVLSFRVGARSVAAVKAEGGLLSSAIENVAIRARDRGLLAEDAVDTHQSERALVQLGARTLERLIQDSAERGARGREGCVMLEPQLLLDLKIIARDLGLLKGDGT